MPPPHLLIFHLDLKVVLYRREYLKSLFARLARLGYTHLCVEIEDKVRLDACPEAAWVEAWTKEEFGAVLQDAREAGLEPFPLVQTLGHLEYVLRHARFAPLRENPGSCAQICPSNPEAARFVRSLCDEVFELFGQPALFHVGGDEARSLATCPACKRKAEREGVSRLYVEHMRRVCEPLIAAGTRPILWADMALAHPEALAGLPREAVFCDWDYRAGDGAPERLLQWTGRKARQFDPARPDAIEPDFLRRFGPYIYPEGTDGSAASWFYTDYLREQGHDVLVAPAARSSGDNVYFPGAFHAPNCAGAAAKALADGRAQGVLVTSWAIRLGLLEAQWFSLAMPGLVASNGKRRAADLMPDAAQTLGLDASAPWRGMICALGETLPFTESRPAIAGMVLGMRKDFPGEVEKFFSDQAAARNAREAVERQLAAYESIESAVDGMCGKDAGRGIVDGRCWRLALHGMRQKARQFIALADGGAKRSHFAEVEQEIAAVWDEAASCLEETYTPASLRRDLTMRLGAEFDFVRRKEPCMDGVPKCAEPCRSLHFAAHRCGKQMML